MCSPESRVIELNDSHQGENHKRRRCLQKERKSKSQREVYLKSSSHARNEGNSSNSPPRKIGEDRHYYECVVCNTGGDLLCCDTCPCTYDIQCLSPPLGSVPAGNWQCQNCSQGADLSTLLSSLQKPRKKASPNKNPPAGTLQSLAEESVVIDEKQNNGSAKRHENSSATNGIVVYTRRVKKKAVEDGVSKPSTDTSGLSSYTTIQSESAEKTDKFTEKFELNTSMPQEQRESDPRPQGSKMLLQSMKTVDSNQDNKLLWGAVPPRSRETVKEKYARLRSRQKQRISLRSINRVVSPSPRIRLDAGITESVRVHTHTPQHSLKKPVLLNPIPLTYKSPSVDHFHSCINSCLNFPILQDPRRIRWIQDDLAGTCYPLMSRGSNVASCSSLARNTNSSDLSQGMVTFWSGQELDSLWVGVRKYRQGNWEKMLRDPSLCFSRFKNAQDLAVRWNFERLKILDSGGLTTSETDNFVSTDLRLNSLVPNKNRVHLNSLKSVTRNLQVDEWELVKSEENGYSSEGTISE